MILISFLNVVWFGEVEQGARHMGLCWVTDHNRWRAPDAIESLKRQSLTCVCVCAYARVCVLDGSDPKAATREERKDKSVSTAQR